MLFFVNINGPKPVMCVQRGVMMYASITDQLIGSLSFLFILHFI